MWHLAMGRRLATPNATLTIMDDEACKKARGGNRNIRSGDGDYFVGTG